MLTDCSNLFPEASFLKQVLYWLRRNHRSGQRLPLQCHDLKAAAKHAALFQNILGPESECKPQGVQTATDILTLNEIILESMTAADKCTFRPQCRGQNQDGGNIGASRLSLHFMDPVNLEKSIATVTQRVLRVVKKAGVAKKDGASLSFSGYYQGSGKLVCYLTPRSLRGAGYISKSGDFVSVTDDSDHNDGATDAPYVNLR